jgi:hypothetical protein
MNRDEEALATQLRARWGAPRSRDDRQLVDEQLAILQAADQSRGA